MNLSVRFVDTGMEPFHVVILFNQKLTFGDLDSPRGLQKKLAVKHKREENVYW